MATAAPSSSPPCAAGDSVRFARGWLVATLAIVFLLGGISLSGTGLTAGIGPAHAQTAAQGERKSLFRAIFGRDKAKRKVVPKRQAAPKRSAPRRKAVQRAKPRNVKRARAVTAKPAPTAIEKSENALTLLVAGDFYASGLVDGLEVAFADNPDLVIVDRSNGLSGFVRTDIIDWPKVIGPMVEEVKPDYLIFMGGSNDRQLLRDDEGVTHQKLTDGWKAAYLKRIDSMGEALKATNVPFTWVGLPSVRFGTMSRDFISFNEWYGAAAAKSPRGKFTDIWDGFADADGNYTRSGPDISGQITLLRRKDGINMTNAGERRLAFYVESDLRKLLEGVPVGGGGSFINEFDGLAGQGAQQPAYDPVETGRTIVIDLDDPVADGGEVLAGETVLVGAPMADSEAVPVPRTTPDAAPVLQREGRVDDFSWPPKEPANTVQPARAVAGTPAPAETLNP